MAVLPLVAAACAGTGQNAGDHGAIGPVVSKSEVARGASAQLGAQAQGNAPTVVCPTDLPLQVGATEQCAVTDFLRAQRHAATVRIDRIEGSTPHFTVDLGAAPLPLPIPSPRG